VFIVAKRKIYGKTWWGKKWISELSDDESREIFKI
jgi:hypothetical protein